MPMYDHHAKFLVEIPMFESRMAIITLLTRDIYGNSTYYFPRLQHYIKN